MTRTSVTAMILFSLAPLLSFSQKMEEQKDPSVEKERVRKNKIKAMKMYRTDWKGGKAAGKSFLSFIEAYDREGNILSQAWLNPDSSAGMRTLFSYGSSGRLERVDLYSADTSKWMLEYFSSGKLKKKSLLLKDTIEQSRTTYVYDDREKLKGICYRTTGYSETFEGCMYYAYDNNGRISEMNFFENIPDFMTKNILKYDAAGNQAEMASYNYSQQLLRKTVYHYDKSRNVTEEILYLKPSEPSASWKYAYEYYSK